MNVNSLQSNQKNWSDQTKLSIDFNEKESLIHMKFKCPLLLQDPNIKLSTFGYVCEITHGIIIGISQFINLGRVFVVKTQIRNNTDYCNFKILV